jgi:hypothetical protein
LRPALSTSVTRAAGSAAARARPGKPPPDPRSAIARARRTSSILERTSESATWTSTAATGSRTLVTALGSRASSSRTVCSASLRGRSSPYRPATAASRSDAAAFHVKPPFTAGGAATGPASVRARLDHEPPVRLVALAVGLDVPAIAQVLVDQTPLGGVHRLQAHRPPRPHSLVRGLVALALQRLLATGPVALSVTVTRGPRPS